MDIFSTTNVGSILGDLTASVTASNMAEVTKAAGQGRLKSQVNAVSDSYSGKFRDIGDQISELQKAQASISAAVDSLKGARSSAESIASLLSQMKDVVDAGAKESDTTGVVAQFQAQLATLRSMTESTSGNMVSGPDQRVSYTFNTAGATIEVQGVNLGSSYSIADSQNRLWVPNKYSTALIAYTAYPDTPANMATSLNGGTVLNSKAADGSINFTVMNNSATPTTLTGTIAAKGVGVYDAWFYQDLTTQSGRDQAKADLTAAHGMAKSEAIRFDSAAAMAQYYYEKIDFAVNSLTGEQTALTEEQGKKIQELQDKFNQSQAALALALQGVAKSNIALATALPAAKGIFGTATSSTPTFDIFA